MEKKVICFLLVSCLLAGCQCRQGSTLEEVVAPVPAEVASEPVFEASVIPASVEARMRGVSYPEDAEIKLSDLRYLRLSYVDLSVLPVI